MVEPNRDASGGPAAGDTPPRNAHLTDPDWLWVPDEADGSGWAEVDWVSAVRGSRYHYRHAPIPDRTTALADLPPFYRVVTRYESPEVVPHENTYFVPREGLADFLAELALGGDAETIWHVQPCADPPTESRVRPADGT